MGSDFSLKQIFVWVCLFIVVIGALAISAVPTQKPTLRERDHFVPFSAVTTTETEE